MGSVGMMLRQVGNTVYPTVDLVKNGDEYSFTTSSTFKTTVIKFKEGEEFDEETLDGRKIRSVITFDGDKMIHDQKGDKGHIIYRVFTETDLTVGANLRHAAELPWTETDGYKSTWTPEEFVRKQLAFSVVYQ
ncbi:putative fatty acid-binding protein [Pseudolycoriella hygida]|uniref:Fatty acid-binding protein n=1 Tax=Pseudolycoriella hygida TaxID=35572 RepID=A0A9Q0MME4_9DIPT|nr:putative fatty acid-binding protein [Pseudolycoriella hygida]